MGAAGIEWIIFYEDKSSFSSLDGEPAVAPRTGVIAIFVEDDSDGRGYSPLFDTDFYCWHERGGWASHDYQGLLDYLVLERNPLVLRGYWIPRSEWRPTLGELSKRLGK